MIRTRIDSDIKNYYYMLENKPHLDDKDIECLMDACRIKFQVDLVFVGEILPETNRNITFSRVSFSDKKYDISEKKYDVEAWLKRKKNIYDEEGLSDIGPEEIGDWDSYSILHYGVYENNECDGIVGMVDFHKKRTWTQEERIAIQKLARILKYILYIDRTRMLSAFNKKKIDSQNHMLEDVFLSTDCGIMRYSYDGKKILSINQAALKILGYESQEELMSCGFDLITDSVMEEDRPQLRESIQSLSKIGDSTSVNYRIVHKDGEVLEVVGRVKLLEENGEMIYQRFLLDCTVERRDEKRKQLENENQQKEIISALSMDYSSVYLVDLDTDTGYPCRMNDYINERYGDIFRDAIQLKKGMEMYIQDVVHPEDREMLKQVSTSENLRKEMEEKKIYYHNYRRLCDDGVEYYQMKAVRLSNWGEKHNIVLGFRTVDEEIRNELEQKQLLADSLEVAKRASKAKTTFLNNISHDIRTPMNAIMGFTTLARSNVDNKEMIEDYLGKIMVSSDHLLSLINDVLDISKIESGEVHLEKVACNLLDLMNDLEILMLEQVNSKQLTWHMDIEHINNPAVYCDKLRLNQVLINLIGNAVKFTNPGGNIWISLTQSEQKIGFGSALYELRVKDDGIGMSEEFQEHMFEQFSRERTSTISGKPGSGLGLAITKNIVEIMGGSIEVCSKEDVGTEFVVRLKLEIQDNEEEVNTNKVGTNKTYTNKADTNKADRNKVDTNKNEIDKYLKADRESKADKEKREKGKADKQIKENIKEEDQKKQILLIPYEGKRILLVEDNELNKEIACEILREYGMHVDTAENGAIAVDKVNASKPGDYDVILMDVQMPVMDGYEATKAIRKLEVKELADIPIIAVTANAFAEDSQMAFESGMNGHIAKPIHIPTLLKTLEETFN